MNLYVRGIRALWVLGRIFASYLVQLGLTLLLRTYERDRATGRDVMVLPDWLRRRRRRLDELNAHRLLGAILRLRGVYIKLGQVLSIMGGFLPRVYTKVLEKLQDQVPARPFAELENTFFEGFGTTPDRLFAHIETEPLAAASLGQVHEARTHDGRRVAVKILYPGIRGIIRIDMRVLRLAIHVYNAFVPMQGLQRVHDALLDLLRRETDYLSEAECMRRMAANFADHKDILFPEVLPELTTKDVLTMTFMEGIKITKIEEMPALGIDPSAVATRLVESFYKQVFVDLFFHTDPHPGNFLVQPGRSPRRPKIVILDFGAVSEVKQEMVDGMIDVLQGVFDEDDALLLKGFYQMGFAAEGGDRALLEKTVRTYFEKLLAIKDRTPGALMRASPKELEALADPEVAREELRQLMRSVEYPEGWFYVERASVLMFWLTGQIDPELDAMQVGFPYVMPLVLAKRAATRTTSGGSGT